MQLLGQIPETIGYHIPYSSKSEYQLLIQRYSIQPLTTLVRTRKDPCLKPWSSQVSTSTSQVKRTEEQT